MISKHKLIELLESATLAEEKVVPIYTRHLQAAVWWTGLAVQKAEKARWILMVLADQSWQHKKIIETLVNELKEDDRDAY